MDDVRTGRARERERETRREENFQESESGQEKNTQQARALEKRIMYGSGAFACLYHVQGFGFKV